MFESFDESTFQALEPIPSATPVQDTLQGAVQCTVQEGAMHSEPVQGYTIEQVTILCGIARRTAFKYAKELLEVWHWLPESEFRANGVYTPFALQEMGKLKEMGLSAYRELTHQQNADAIAASQKVEPDPEVEVKGELAKVEVVPGLTRLQSNIYEVGDFGSSRLTAANQRLTQAQQNLNLTLDQTREAMKNLALQQYQSSLADEAEKQQRLNSAYMDAYQEELALIQARNMAREDARMQAQQLEQAMGKASAPNGSNASA